MSLSDQDLNQVKTIVHNLHINNKKIPYFHDLQNHAVYGQFFNDMDGEDIQVIQELITSYVEESVKALSTKWGEMFRRFYAMNKETFRTFRQLNGNISNVETQEFQTLGKDIEQQLFKFENILTKNMMKKPQGLDKTIGAFYDIVYAYFPLYWSIK